MGSAEFASMVATLLGLSQGIAVLLSQGLSLLGDSIADYDHHSIGFSGVLFGMKAVLTGRSNDLMRMSVILIPEKYVVWVDLFLTHALLPQTSFLGHLGGLLAGKVYLWLKRLFKGQDPLTLLISGGARVVTSQVRFALKLLKSVLPQGHITGRGRVGCHSSEGDCPRGLWRCSTCTNYNSFATDICEMCSTMPEDHAFPQGQHHQDWCIGELSVEELRRRRLDRLDR
ncbi:rhomboid-like protein 14, mitochondrial [Panicum miliaceum]|uniref:Rhomboid-like protein 14, mitochondrial n=1 Tax=Panicum miliaceum TaxID=4540 RepID=A0A3L6R346_PANMI|nr:rhomboid-like protein 14, mitochondrial [Panicum miliaceum]